MNTFSIGIFAYFNTVEMKVLVIVILMDIVFGILRAIKEKSINSTIGIDGMIRKIAMLTALIFLRAIDFLVPVDLIGFIPEAVKEFIHVERVGIDTVFSILFIVFEFISILKNMILCNLPIPKKLQKFLEKIMNEYTEELTKNNEEIIEEIIEESEEK